MRRLPYVHTYKDRHGRRRHYFRRRGYSSVRLPGTPGSPEFMEAYEAALAGETVARQAPGAARTKPGSVAALVARYYRSAEYVSLKASTQRTYRGIIERFRAEHGDKPVGRLQREHVRRIVAARAETPAAANNLLRIIRLLMQFAIAEGFRADDPTAGVRAVKTRSDGFHTWTDDEIARFEATHPVGTRERLALALLLYTAQRRSDVVRMGRQHVKDGRILVRQEKTGATLWIPLHPALDAILREAPADNLTFLVTAQGKPFTPAGFGNWFKDAARAAGLDGCSAHGLRKAAARRLADAGCTAHEIMAITGHKTLKEVTRYTVEADQRRLAGSAMARLGNIGGDQVANPRKRLANSGHKPLKRKDKK